ncbi:DUF3119 family protein [Thermoleptolyngbya sichuanensis]|uniref:DUF3119 family protein n=1 Tax=Thermoleptolyngbya sichuanensis TaxID=2885951 RepID=UPI001C131CC7
MNSPSAIAPTDPVQLAPSYRLPIGLLLLALPLVWLQVWVGAAVGLFGVFLLVQTATLRLHFTDTALDIFHGETRIRRFPYQDWQNWAIFWPPVPILFYFKEVNSIHFLPILFDPKALQACLEQRCPTVSE